MAAPADVTLARADGDQPFARTYLAAIADALPAVIAYLDMDERYVYANRFYIERYGRRNDLVGRTAREVVGADAYAHLASHLARARAGKEACFETEVKRPGGTSLWVSATYLPDFGPDGRVRGIIAFSEDITERRRAEERLARMHEVTAALSRARTVREVADTTCRIGADVMQAYAGILWLAEADGALHLAGSWGSHREFVQQFSVLPAGDDRFPAVDVLRTGRPLWVESEEGYARAVPALFQAVKAAGRLTAFGAVPIAVHGRPGGVIVFAHTLPHSYDEDEQSFYLSVALYCSQALERARLLDEAREARESAERANRVKDEFLAMLGHELRNPLAPIVTALQVMNARRIDAFASERRIIERQVRHLGLLVDDLLDVSRIAAGRVTLDALPVKVADVVVRGIEMARPLIEERRHELHVEIDGSHAVRADPTRLAQVVANLLNNAAKYTPPNGHISIAGRREGGDVVLRVRDDGIGIAPDLLPRVFDLFEQGAQAPNRPLGGLGLGLAIVKNLVALHGGSVEARSDGTGRGAEFVVRLPVHEGAVETAELRDACAVRPSPTSHLALARVLVVDDNADAAETVSAVLTLLGYAVSTACDGPSALTMASRRPPEVAVLDLGLPGMDGYELSRRLRILAPGLHLVALTGYGQDTDRARTRAFGFAEHLVKPVDAGTLERVLARLVGGRP